MNAPEYIISRLSDFEREELAKAAKMDLPELLPTLFTFLVGKYGSEVGAPIRTHAQRKCLADACAKAFLTAWKESK